MLGRFTAAETNLRDNSLREFGYWGTGALSSVEPELWLALALARQGRAEDAGRILSPVMERVRTMKSQGAGSLRSREVLAQALLVSALAQPGDVDGRGRQAAAIDEATQVLAALSDESKALPHIRILLRWISEEQERFASRDNSSQRIGR